jgi:glutathione peroxidase
LFLLRYLLHPHLPPLAHHFFLHILYSAYARYVLIFVVLALSGGVIYKLTSSKRANKLPGADDAFKTAATPTPRTRRSFKSEQQKEDSVPKQVPSPIPQHQYHHDTLHEEPHATDVHTADHYAYHVDDEIHDSHHHQDHHPGGHYDHYEGHISNEGHHDNDGIHNRHYDANHFDEHSHPDTEHHAPTWDHTGEEHHDSHYHQDIDHLHDEIHHEYVHHGYGDDKDHMDDHLGLYDMGFTATDINGQHLSLDTYRGKVTLFVNVASQCGYTEDNYRVLQAVYDKYRSSGFEIIAFPCNDFGNQEPQHNWEIAEFARNHSVSFHMMAKIHGINSSPIFTWLRAHSPKVVGSDAAEGAQIDWNFNKFLVDKNGHVAVRYASGIEQGLLEKDVYNLLVIPYQPLKAAEHH